MKSREIKEKIKSEGYIQAIIIFEVVGSPKEYVEKALKNHLYKLKQDPSIEIIREEIEPPVRNDKLWSTLAEVEILVKGLEKFTWICMNFMPASIEVMAPKELVFKGRDLTNWLNDLLAKMHEIAMISQQLGQQNKLMLKNVNALARNAVLLSIEAGTGNPKEIAKKVGIAENDLKPLFDAMLKEGVIEKKGKGYTRK